jgi:NAD(P) transhydrogenase subunit alpha
MKIAILAEREVDEARVGATPESVAKLVGLGINVSIEKGAGEASNYPDAQYKEAGASIAANMQANIKNADTIFCVRRPKAASLTGVKKDALILAIMDPFGYENEILALAKKGVSAFAMEFMPRITRAQVMDVLSSQSNLAGYRSVIEAANLFERAIPMMMTAAGTIRPAKAFVMGAGVAGLQAIATARRIGAIVSATDVRAAAKEQVESLGAKFIAVENDEFKQAETSGGYAKPMSAEYQKEQAELVSKHIAKQDIVITTALIPGRDAPKLISKKMVESMAAGSVIVDLAAERGGNCELTKAGKVIKHKQVSIIGYTNIAARVGTSASALYANNLLNFFNTLFDKEAKTLKIDWEDELVKATVLTKSGKIIHPNIKVKTAKKAAPKKAITKKTIAKKTVAKKATTKKSTKGAK